MNLQLKNKIALVTGGSQGIGKAIAQSLAQEGAKVIICSRTEEHLKKAKEEIKRATDNSIVYKTVDLSKKEDIETLIDSIKEEYGKLDILINNTGGPPSGGLQDIKDEQWIPHFENTVMSVIRLTKLALPLMKGWGRIVNIESVSVKNPIPNLIMSNTLRPAVIGFAKSVSDEVAKNNITINTICPGTVDTTRLQSLAKDWADKQDITIQEMIQILENNAPAKRLGTPKEIADVVTFLCSEQASFVTGTCIQVDGGRIRSIY